MENNFQAGDDQDEAVFPPPEGTQLFPWPEKGFEGQEYPTGEQTSAWRDCPDGEAAAGGVYPRQFHVLEQISQCGITLGIRYPFKRSQRKWSSSSSSYSFVMDV